MSLTSELLELSQHLQQEHLFVSTEREQLQRLYQNVTLLSEKLAHTSWIGRQQKLNLQHFIDQGTNAGETVEVYSTNNQLEETNFVDSYKVFSYHDSKYGELLKFLYESPNFLAIIINEAEKNGGLSIPRMINMTVMSVYGNCIFQEDEQAALRLLRTLLDCQVANSDNPRKLICRQKSSFSLVYKHLCESLFSARLFLTAALYEPTMKLLTEDEWFYDIDPDKAVVRFPSGEKLKRFGEPGTEHYEQKHAQYRAYIVDKLVALALRFINSIKANIHCFPASLGWLVSQVYRVLTERGKVDMQEVRASCADLVFALFICPAICDPEPHGITSDVPISHIARHNLMQMAQIIQVLAISQWEEINPKFRDLYGRFEKGCMSSVLDLFLEGPWDDLSEQVVTSSAKQTIRSAVLLTATDIREMVGFLRNTTIHIEEKNPHKKGFEQLLSALPADMPPSYMDSLSVPGSGGVMTPIAPSSSGSPLSPETPSTPTTERKLLKTKGYRKKRSATNAPQIEEVAGENAETEGKPKQAADVLVISIYPPGDCPGMLAEKTVLSSVQDTETKKISSHSIPSSISTPQAISTPQTAPNPEIQEKRTRFSLSHDQESIGNASDYQEMISEAASSHSVEDENELETDNFSDMMSANVSGRGSPSISGRDTPLSQAGSVEENPPAPQLPVPVPETVRKENRVDVTDRFGKFEIKAELAMERDECKSTVSDTWSTDVLASDSEPPEQNQTDRLEEVAEEIARPLLLGSEPISEISETASDAWSTDVLASDTEEKHSELLKDLEQDLISGVLDRDEGDSSLGQDEVDEQVLEGEQLGAVGGSGVDQQQGIDSNDVFPEVFGEPSNKPGDDSDRANNGKKISSIVHHFQSGPSLQLPTIHRLPSQAVKHGENRATPAGSVEGSSPSGSAVTSTSTIVHPSTGARSKVRDKKRERESRGSSGGGGDEGANNEFDPLSSGASSGGGRKKTKERWLWNRSKGNVADHHHKGDNVNAASRIDEDSPPTGATALPGPPTAGRTHTSSRDSGIDIWVNTNWQMSGSSSRSPAAALVNTRSSLDSISPRHTVPLPGRSSLDSNLQRLHSLDGRGMPGTTSTPDSGINSYMSSTVSSSLDTSTPPMEMDNPLFHLRNSQSSTDIETNPFAVASTSSDQSAVVNNEDSLLLIDQEPETSQDGKRRLKKGAPQIEVSGIFKKISEPEKNADETVEPETPNIAEQQLTNINERRLSSALTLFDPFYPETDETPTDLLSVDPDHMSGENIKDLTISFDDSVKFIDDESLTDKVNTDSVFVSKINGPVEGVEEESKKSGQEMQGQKGHSRQDSSGSSHSASSLKLVTSSTTGAKPAADNVSHLSDDKDLADTDRQKKPGGFLRTMKDKLNKGMKRKNFKFEKDLETENDGTGTLKASSASGAATSKESPALPNSESTDDILAKYRTPKKVGQGKSSSNGSIITNNNTSTVNNNTNKQDGSESTGTAAAGGSNMVTFSGMGRNNRGGSISDTQQLPEDGGPPFLDLDNLEGCPAFQDAKRKLRLVLSMADVYYGLSQVQSSSPREGASSRKNEVITILTAQLAEALNLQNKDLVAQLYEVIRCMKMFDSDGCRKLIRSMKEDYGSRSAYISYLVRCRQGLLSTRNHLQKLLSRVTRDREICSKHLTTVCARIFLERRERKMWKFITEFQKLSMSDEKIELIAQFLEELYQEMSTDVLWKAATDTQIEEGQQAIERLLMSRIYIHAMFPNGEGDVSRDQVLQEHLLKLSKVISPMHKDLRIPRMYHMECPWPAAQKEIFMINAYRTPKDKIQCVLRCAKTIMNLLSMANEKSVPAADDFMPVLIYVLIKANPFGLLSTIQYVNSFYEQRLHGEEQYWWLQVTSAVEFIKTMDYST